MAGFRVTSATLLMVVALASGAGVLARQTPGDWQPREAPRIR